MKKDKTWVDKKDKTWVDTFCRALYIIILVLFFVSAVLLTVNCIRGFWAYDNISKMQEIQRSTHHLVQLVDGFIVALVLTDVIEFFLREKVAISNQNNPQKRDLSNFLIIIIIALILDALLNTLLIDEVNNYYYLIYTSASFITAIFLIMTLIFYGKRKISNNNED